MGAILKKFMTAENEKVDKLYLLRKGKRFFNYIFVLPTILKMYLKENEIY